MTPEDIDLIRQILPERMRYPYYADRENAWLLARRMPAKATVRSLRQGTLARYLESPVLQPLVAKGGGLIERRDVALLGDANATGAELRSAALSNALERVWSMPWHDFELTLDVWGQNNEWWTQTSIKGGNLVLQMGFPSDHARLMGKYLGVQTRKDFEFDLHPIQTRGRPTLAWARLEIDLDAGVALIEEVQSDWLRMVKEEVEWLTQQNPRARHLRTARQYDEALRAEYGKRWPRAMLLAALILLRDELGIREVYVHRPETGKRLKRIDGLAPPVSLYSTLPKRFGFEQVSHAPEFLQKKRRRDLSVLQKEGPLFWYMAF